MAPIQILNTPAAQLSFQEVGGKGSLIGSIGIAAGGGNVAGFVSGKASLEIDVDAIMLINAGFDLAAAKWPSIASAIQLAKAAVDAEIAKI